MLYDPKWDKKLKEIMKPKKAKPVKPLEPWRQALLDAADLIEKKGWVQKRFSRGGYCTIGAINAVLGRRPSDDDPFGGKNKDVFRIAVKKLADRVPCDINWIFQSINWIFQSYDTGGVDRVERWNDNWGRDGAQVIAKLRTVAKG